MVEDEVILNNNENFNISKTAAAQHLKMRAVRERVIGTLRKKGKLLTL